LKRREITPSKIALLICCNKRSKLTVLFLKELFPFSSNLHAQLLLLQQINSAIFEGVISANLKRREITPLKIALLICCNKRS
jgi:hypothetical protein